jgi:hypothetical protein
MYTQPKSVFRFRAGYPIDRTMNPRHSKLGTRTHRVCIRANSNSIPALVTVLTRQRELTRKQLRELALTLDKAGFSEANLAVAWREMTNQEIAARIVG